MERALRLVLSTAVLPAISIAQQTWIVDPLGTGNFTSLYTAIATVSAGDTLLLRGGGTFSSQITIDKQLNIIAEGPQRPRLGYVQVQTGASGITFVGVQIASGDFSVSASCEDVEFYWCTTTAAQLTMHDCRLLGVQPGGSWGTFLVDAGAVSLSNCLVMGASQYQSPMSGGYCYNHWAGPAMQVGWADVTATDCSFSGGIGTTSTATNCNYPAVGFRAVTVGGTLRATRCQFVSGAGGTVPDPVLVSGGTFEFDASTLFSPATSAGQLVFLPGTSATAALPGGAIPCTVETAPFAPAVLVASLGSHAPTAFPQAVGLVWLDPIAYVVLALGVTNAQGSLPASIPLPSWAPRGLPLTIQGAAAQPGGPLSAGAPVVVLVR